MASIDVRFSGAVPANYEQYLVPLLFRPYAQLLSRRAAEFHPRRILETAAGTGVVTRELTRTLPDAEIVATDLNQAMLDVAPSARQRRTLPSAKPMRSSFRLTTAASISSCASLA